MIDVPSSQKQTLQPLTIFISLFPSLTSSNRLHCASFALCTSKYCNLTWKVISIPDCYAQLFDSSQLCFNSSRNNSQIFFNNSRSCLHARTNAWLQFATTWNALIAYFSRERTKFCLLKYFSNNFEMHLSGNKVPTNRGCEKSLFSNDSPTSEQNHLDFWRKS